MGSRRLPIGIQDFEKLRLDGYLYVDKTAYIYRLAQEGNPCFLSRPRRFGKSLLVSTMQAYFEGKRELFEGLAIAGLEKEWKPCPVIALALNINHYNSLAALEDALNAALKSHEEIWGRDMEETTLATRFRGLIRRAAEKTGSRTAVLIDEYDKPLTDTLPVSSGINDPVLHEKMRDFLQGFYGVLKESDHYLRFVFLTGVTKFAKVSIFSTLNQLRDISLSRDYAGICGISEPELTACFQPEIQALAEQKKLSFADTLTEMRKRYNGYHFSEESEGVYNPFSVLNVLQERRISNYWFRTGTPTFLAEALKAEGFDLQTLSSGIKTLEESMTNYRVGYPDPIPLLYQSGYLTIKDYDDRTRIYTLGYPNDEVEEGFLYELLPLYTPWIKDDRGIFVLRFIEDLQKGDVDAFMNRLRAFFAGIPYELNGQTERHYQTLFYLVFSLMGQFTQAEVRSAAGRADTVVITGDTVYVFEFKLTGKGTVADALAQIDDKGYLIPYMASGRKLVKVGAVFDPATRTLGEWLAL